eukprot:TRINITY_DN25951_c0_g1_i2.p1 TRINITY_DN25951_c0_g1~~TRINITY_DN25951_c0_g1_i2.p1  ORF type:complete len:1026 (+),score=169.95 TRINITY_DN25951_c0_g1_i2:39-3080(+)
MSDAGPIEKPQTDHREYCPLQLENGMRVLMISDSKCDKAAAALSVKVGSAFDPPEVPGLAHFLEHMLFLGTEKFPREDEYNEFLAKHGGSSNAYTADCVTNFYFGVSPDHLEGALERFAQFFLKPLFQESATDRELKAVDSEHSKNQQSDGWRWNQLLKNDVNPKHPMCHFGTGNSDTLKVMPERDGYPVRKRLLEFHDKYYSANQMCFVVLGKESAAELEQLVRSYFGPVVNNGVSVPAGSELGGIERPFCQEGWPRLVQVMPVKDVRSLAFQFVIPQQMPMKWRTKPTRYLSFLIGHEGKGSLLSALKTQGLATELTAGPSMDDLGACIFEVGIQLTEKGETEVKAVGEHVFTYIRLMQQLPVSEDLFTENQRIEEMNFRFRSVGHPVSTVSSLSHSLQDGLPIEKVLSGPSKVLDLDRSQIQEAGAYLTCANLRLLWASKTFTEKDCVDTERWYGTRYVAKSLPQDWHDAWEACRLGSDEQGNEGSAESAVQRAEAGGAKLGLAMPLPNPFVAENLELKVRPEAGISKKPVRLALPDCLFSLPPASSPAGQSSLIQVYFRQDDTFDLPRAYLNIEIYCPWTSQSIEQRIIVSAWCQAVAEELNELSYDAEVAGLYYGLNSGSRGLSLSLAGYQDKLPILLRTTTTKMAALQEVSEQTWGIVYTVMLRNAKIAAKTRQPYQQAAELERRCLHRTAITSAECLTVIQNLTREKVQGIGSQVLDQCYADALLQGNYTEAEVAGVLEALQPILRPSKLLQKIPGLAVAALPDGPESCALIRWAGSNPDEKNGAVTVTLQASEDSLESVIFCQLAGQVLGQRCFDELRTKQQLGYIVALQAYSDTGSGGGYCGLKAIVQSEKHPAEVHRRIDDWLANALAGLANEEENDDVKLGEYLEALLTKKREKPKKLADEFSPNWSEVISRHFRFTRRDEGIAFLEGPRQQILAAFRKFVRDCLIPAPRIAVEVLGAAASEAAANEAEPYKGACRVLDSIGDIEDFRTKLSWRESNTSITP